MSYTGNENHSVTLSEAAEMTANFRATAAADATIAHMFGKQAISDILAQANCVGIRIYYAINDDDEKQLVICGVLANGNDIYEGLLADRSFLCPTACSDENPLNSDV